MSSLSATQADGYYVPPEYFESGKYKKQSRNQFAKSKGHNQYLQKGIVRFELPYKGVCQGPTCSKKSIMRGTRYNAKKVKTDESYFSTPIWEFQLACRDCQHPWVIRTNPQARGFDYVSGITIQAGQEDSNIADVAAFLANDSSGGGLERLESTAQGKRKTLTELEHLQQLQAQNQKTTLEDADRNAQIRKGFRIDRKAKRHRQSLAKDLGWREGMEVITETNLADTVAAKSMVYGRSKQSEQARFAKVRKSSIFDVQKDSQSRRRLRQKREHGYRTTLENDTLVPDTATSSRAAGQSEQTAKSPNPALQSSTSLRRARSQADSAARSKRKVQIGVYPASSSSRLQQPPSSKVAPPSSSLNDMLASYGSESETD